MRAAPGDARAPLFTALDPKTTSAGPCSYATLHSPSLVEKAERVLGRFTSPPTPLITASPRSQRGSRPPRGAKRVPEPRTWIDRTGRLLCNSGNEGGGTEATPWLMLASRHAAAISVAKKRGRENGTRVSGIAQSSSPRLKQSAVSSPFLHDGGGCFPC